MGNTFLKPILSSNKDEVLSKLEVLTQEMLRGKDINRFKTTMDSYKESVYKEIL